MSESNLMQPSVTTGNPTQGAVGHPDHYNSHPSGVECIDVIRYMPGNIGQAVKYVWRMGKKAIAGEVEDIMKARFYLLDEAALRSCGQQCDIAAVKAQRLRILEEEHKALAAEIAALKRAGITPATQEACT